VHVIVKIGEIIKMMLKFIGLREKIFQKREE